MLVGNGHISLVADVASIHPFLASRAACSDRFCFTDDSDDAAKLPFSCSKVFCVPASLVYVVAKQCAIFDLIPRAVGIFKASSQDCVKLCGRDILRKIALELLNGFCCRWRVICRLSRRLCGGIFCIAAASASVGPLPVVVSWVAFFAKLVRQALCDLCLFAPLRETLAELLEQQL